MDVLELLWEYYLNCICCHCDGVMEIAEAPEHLRDLIQVPSPEAFLFDVENLMEIPEQMADDFRRHLAVHVGQQAIKGRFPVRLGSHVRTTCAIVTFYCHQLCTARFPDSAFVHNDCASVRIAQQIVSENLPRNRPILADALEDAGVDNQLVLEHLRKHQDYHPMCSIVERISQRVTP